MKKLYIKEEPKIERNIYFDLLILWNRHKSVKNIVKITHDKVSDKIQFL